MHYTAVGFIPCLSATSFLTVAKVTLQDTLKKPFLSNFSIYVLHLHLQFVSLGHLAMTGSQEGPLQAENLY